MIITGHYGSGKTEFAVNLAVVSKGEQNNVSIADLDIVNPYFRSRERLDLFDKLGIKVHDSSLRGMNVDIPAVSPTVLAAIQNKDYISILDVGGDDVGARVLRQYQGWIEDRGYEMYFVVNANRPETGSVESVLDYMQAVEGASGLKITGIVNNTHLLKETTMEDVERGASLCAEVSKVSNVPIIYHTMMENLVNEIKNKNIEQKKFPLTLYMRSDWMS